MSEERDEGAAHGHGDREAGVAVAPVREQIRGRAAGGAPDNDSGDVLGRGEVEDVAEQEGDERHEAELRKHAEPDGRGALQLSHGALGREVPAQVLEVDGAAHAVPSG